MPRVLIAEINAFGGRMPDATGTSAEAIQHALTEDIRKTSEDRDSRLVATATTRTIFTTEARLVFAGSPASSRPGRAADAPSPSAAPAQVRGPMEDSCPWPPNRRSLAC